MSVLLLMLVACASSNDSDGELDLGGIWHWVCYCDGQNVEEVIRIEDQGDLLVVSGCDGKGSATWTQHGNELTHSYVEGTSTYTDAYTLVGDDYFGNGETGDDAVWACKVSDDLTCPGDLDPILAMDCFRQEL
jgi:hypothetical protein